MQTTEDTTASERLLRGIGGIPVRLKGGQHVPNLKRDDPEALQPKPVVDAHARVFDMADEDDVSDYEHIWDKSAKGQYVISAEDRHWCDSTQNFKIFLRWGAVFLEIDEERGGDELLQ